MLAAVAVFFTAPSAAAQDDAPSKADLAAAEASRNRTQKGDYVGAAEALHAVAFDAAGKPKPGYAYDTWVEADTLLRGEPVADIDPAKPVSQEDGARLRAAIPRDAIAEIVARARKTRVVILNEDHGTPRSRAFGLEVARALRPVGYDVLAAETFNNDPDDAKSAAMMADLAKRGHVQRFSGYYTKDPVFADFVRQSLALGYRPVAYESTIYTPPKDVEDSIARREKLQAEYLVSRVLKRDPKAKLFVYVGYSHAAEAPLPSTSEKEPPRLWMANRLKTLTGIDPLTIEQTSVAEHPSFGGTAAYDLIADQATGRSIVPYLAGKPLVFGQYSGAVDLQVVHPRTRYVAGRQDWRARMGGQPTPIPGDLLPKSGTRLIQAYIVDEGEDTVPVDQVLVTAGTKPPVLFLPAKKVRFVTKDVPK